MPLSDIYLLVHKQTFGSEVLENAYTFVKLDEGTSVDLNNGFAEDILPAIQQIQCAQIVTQELNTYCLGNLGDSNIKDINTAGHLTGEQMLPVFNAVGYTFRPSSRVVRPGSKRIAGIPESDQVDGTITNSAYITDMNTLKAAFGAYVSDDDTNFFALCIVKRVKYNPDPEKPDHFAYRLPETDEELVYSQIGAVRTSTKITHQVSRGNSG